MITIHDLVLGARDRFVTAGISAGLASLDAEVLARQVLGWDRARFLADMTALGDALLEVTGAVRINYAVFGNLEPALHAHVFPRYADEPEALRHNQPWAYDWAAAPARLPTWLASPWG